MALTLPLTLLGLGLLVTYLFAAATHAMPLFAGVTAGFAATAAGLSVPAAILIGAATCLFAIAIGRFAGLTVRGPVARAALLAAFAIPAVIAGGAIGGALANLAGLTGFAIIAAPLAGLACGLVAATRLVMRQI